jgi:hypothetical protein
MEEFGKFETPENGNNQDGTSIGFEDGKTFSERQKKLKNEKERILFAGHAFGAESFAKLKKSDEPRSYGVFDDNVRLQLRMYKSPAEEEEFIEKELKRKLPGLEDKVKNE